MKDAGRPPPQLLLIASCDFRQFYFRNFLEALPVRKRECLNLSFLCGPQRISAFSAVKAISTQRPQRYAEDRREDLFTLNDLTRRGIQVDDLSAFVLRVLNYVRSAA